MRHALVTAGTKGIGKSVAERFLHKGYSVTVSYRRDEEAMKQMKADWKHAGDRLQFVQADVTKADDLKQLVAAAYQTFGRLDVLVNNAGPYIFERKKLMDYTENEWHEMVHGNLSSMFYLFQAAVPIMRKQQYGRIVTYGFQGAQEAPAWIYRSAYAAAKTGLVSLTKTVSIEEAENGITVNMVCPGVITDEYKEAAIADAKQVTDVNTPVGRPAAGEDIARTIDFLCEDHADMITGSVVEVTGGVDVLHKRR
ncbi:3-oxoacyl-[acyl-carrier protein] reductase [Alteribacillus persepolensis]|uniref:3-oxoacyl-[acyl-carrier protein] reductase n=1 Tax=Alteribacillus persepolensis TaxID=568899 RepID=A0A1G8BH11_9BACI|nr:SDR family oxidoreductase [Alteribacillus persepolensis]SDH32507.1 3-oxoacyl-[acyl-carrier protein] reductase [Alteribacillus persepolensis]